MTGSRARPLLLALAAALALGSCEGGAEPRPRRVRIEARHSRFSPATVEVRAGETIVFEVVNRDPIAHEFIIGTESEHARHERGTEQDHDGTPGAISLAAGETDTVSYPFHARGTLIFACHLPGHYAFGMRGVIEVR